MIEHLIFGGLGEHCIQDELRLTFYKNFVNCSSRVSLVQLINGRPFFGVKVGKHCPTELDRELGSTRTGRRLGDPLWATVPCLRASLVI